MSETDILAYSAVGTKSEDDDTIFSSGGAILEALAEQNPGINESIHKEQKALSLVQ